jgi:hypothetical protein
MTLKRLVDRGGGDYLKIVLGIFYPIFDRCSFSESGFTK